MIHTDGKKTIANADVPFVTKDQLFKSLVKELKAWPAKT